MFLLANMKLQELLFACKIFLKISENGGHDCDLLSL